MDYFRVKNWEKFQHYKDRTPPWIKLHRDLLRDYEFACLQDASKLLLIEIWLLASQKNNLIPADVKWLKRQLPYDGKITLKPLFDNGFIEMEQNASNTLAKCSLETEAYKSIKEDKEKDPSFWQANDLESEFAEYKKMRTAKKKPFNETAEKLLITALKKLRDGGHDMREALERSTANCWLSVFPPKDEVTGNNGREHVSRPPHHSRAKWRDNPDGSADLIDETGAVIQSTPPANRTNPRKANA